MTKKLSFHTVLSIIFFFSGASALIFEALWFRLAGLTLGNSVWASSIVLSSFMAGLALGNGLAAFYGHKVKSPIRLYIIAEIVIAIFGILLVLIFPKLTTLFTPIFRLFEQQPFITNLIRTIIAFLLMLIPATAMGVTLPILVKTMYSQDQNFGRVLGSLYGWNTMGAVAGVVLGEMLLFKYLGMIGSCFVAGALNVLAAIGAFLFISDHAISQPPSTTKLTSRAKLILLAGFFSGLVILALEVIWFRFMMLFFAAYTWNFAAMLAVVLMGISLGGLLASRCFGKKAEIHGFAFFMLLLNGILVVLTYNNILLLFSFLHKVQVPLLYCSIYLMFPISFISGVVFTMLGKALYVEICDETKASGLLTLANTFGGMLGSAIAALVFIPVFGIEKSFFVLSCAYAITAFFVYDKKRKVSSFAITVVFIFFLFFFSFGLMQKHLIDVPVKKYINQGSYRIAFKESATETIQILQRDFLGQRHYNRLVTNDHPMSSTTLSAKRYMKMFAYWPIALHPNPKNALLVCFGCGSTAKALTNTASFKHIDVVDISEEIVNTSRIIFPDTKENPINDPRVKVHIEDGRFFLNVTRRKYDVITGEPPPLRHSGVANLYSQEYFQLLYNSLAPGGIVTYWLPVYQLQTREAKSIAKAFANVFENSSLWTGCRLEWMLVGIKKPFKKVNAKKFAQQWLHPKIGAQMRRLGFVNPQQFGAFFIADGARLYSWIKDSAPLTDNYAHFPLLKTRVVDQYWKFMNAKESKNNFLTSKTMQQIWPESIYKATGEFFETQFSINRLLAGNPDELIYLLHQCIENPLLEDYIIWAMGSNGYYQKTMDATPIEARKKYQVQIYHHLAARAIASKNYQEADKLLAAKMEATPKSQIQMHWMICKYRMYLLYKMREYKKAMSIKKHYIYLAHKGQKKRQQQMNIYWNWLVRIFK